jgi:hypothetical protein
MASLSLIVNSTEPVAPIEHLWTEEELQAGWESFEAALVIWRNEKGYDPRRKTELTAENAENTGKEPGSSRGLPVLTA